MERSFHMKNYSAPDMPRPTICFDEDMKHIWVEFKDTDEISRRRQVGYIPKGKTKIFVFGFRHYFVEVGMVRYGDKKRKPFSAPTIFMYDNVGIDRVIVDGWD